MGPGAEAQSERASRLAPQPLGSQMAMAWTLPIQARLALSSLELPGLQGIDSKLNNCLVTSV